MKIRFWWQDSFGALVPACDADDLNHDGVSLLSSLLTDSGGGSYLDALPWLQEGLRCIEAVKRGDTKEGHWGRDAWAADFNSASAKIYSQYQEDYSAEMSLDAFEKALRAWTDFIQTTPDANAIVTLDV